MQGGRGAGGPLISCTLKYFKVVRILTLRRPAAQPVHPRREPCSAPKILYKRAMVSLTLRLICGNILGSLLTFLTCIYETLLDLEIYKMRVSSGIVFF